VAERVLICFSTGSGWISRAIRKLTDSPVSHCFVLYESRLWGGWWAVQVDKHGPRKIVAKRALGKSVRCFECSASLARGLRAVREYVGSSYDFLGIFGFLLKALAWKVFRINTPNTVQSKSAWFCSEFVAAIFNASKLKDWKARDAASVDPGDPLSYVLTSKLFAEVDVPKEARK
jgi:hypothetical protein